MECITVLKYCHRMEICSTHPLPIRNPVNSSRVLCNSSRKRCTRSPDVSRIRLISFWLAQFLCEPFLNLERMVNFPSVRRDLIGVPDFGDQSTKFLYKLLPLSFHRFNEKPLEPCAL